MSARLTDDPPSLAVPRETEDQRRAVRAERARVLRLVDRAIGQHRNVDIRLVLGQLRRVIEDDKRLIRHISER